MVSNMTVPTSFIRIEENLKKWRIALPTPGEYKPKLPTPIVGYSEKMKIYV
jgi:hypothetical protein